MPVQAPDLARDYADWLKERITTLDQGGSQILSTPFLDPFNDGIRVFVKANGGQFTLHDNGDTLETLTDLGVKIEDSERRGALIQRAIAGCGVRFANRRFEINATHANLPQRAHFLITAILRLNDLWMTAAPRSWVDFSELVAEFFDAHNVLYNRDLNVPGRTVDHQMDFVIPLPKRRERLIKLVGNPNTQTAKLISFTWLELRESRPDAERIVLINDLRPPDPLEEESEEESRSVSDQTVAILEGYSSGVFRWSERDTIPFQKLWHPEPSNN